MISKRVMAVILLRGGRAVKSKQFTAYRDVGAPASQARIYFANGIDELVVLNTESHLGIAPLLSVLPAIGDRCFIPIAAGGGVTSVDHAADLIKAGCEKVVIRTALDVIPRITQRYGRQAVVECRDYSGPPPMGPSEAGEVLYQAKDRDGMMQGYDLTPITSNEPIIRLGGCGSYDHLAQAFAAGADACAASSLWAFSDSNPLRAKAYLRNKGFLCRGR